MSDEPGRPEFMTVMSTRLSGDRAEAEKAVELNPKDKRAQLEYERLVEVPPL